MEHPLSMWEHQIPWSSAFPASQSTVKVWGREGLYAVPQFPFPVMEPEQEGLGLILYI